MEHNDERSSPEYVRRKRKVRKERRKESEGIKDTVIRETVPGMHGGGKQRSAMK